MTCFVIENMKNQLNILRNIQEITRPYLAKRIIIKIHFTIASKALQTFLQSIDSSRLTGAYNVGRATAGVSQALKALHGTPAPALMAHGFTPANQAMLIDGSLAYVLHQDIHYCVLTAARVLKGLCENVRGTLNIVQPRVEILTAENLH